MAGSKVKMLVIYKRICGVFPFLVSRTLVV